MTPADRTPDPANMGPNAIVPPNDDPGGAHAKGYSADPRGEAPVPADGPIPMAKDAPKGIIQPERDGKIQPTGRSDPDYDPNDRVVERG